MSDVPLNNKYCKVCQREIIGDLRIVTLNGEYYCLSCSKKKFNPNNILDKNIIKNFDEIMEWIEDE